MKSLSSFLNWVGQPWWESKETSWAGLDTNLLHQFSLLARLCVTCMSLEHQNNSISLCTYVKCVFLFSFNILAMFPNCGYRRTRGFLRAKGLHVQWRRIQDSMRRVCPEGILMRALQLTTVERRIYTVRSPLSLWHVDGNHKLIR